MRGPPDGRRIGPMGRPPERNTDRLLVALLATVAAVILIICGFAVVGAFVFIVFGMANFGSNK
ncbi:hypothetical protein AB0K34_00825 [Actinomadura sp. NPDC049382]|uniref:hypothetical protein n=1 Tax=Actinomadura sp. NPDC049382 TaxID=3158220 RepID=UPI00342C3004